MTDERRGLIQRAMALPGFEWRVGVLVHARGKILLRVSQVTARGTSFVGVTATGAAHGWRRHGRLDLSDDATAGCLLGLAGWPSYELVVHPDGDVEAWFPEESGNWTARAATKAEAVSVAVCRLVVARGWWTGGGS